MTTIRELLKSLDKSNIQRAAYKLFELSEGELYRFFKLELTSKNVEAEIKRLNNVDLLTSYETTTKAGNIKTNYKYCGKVYRTLASLNKKGYIAAVPVKINCIADVLLYLDYSVEIGSGKSVYAISDKPVYRDVAKFSLTTGEYNQDFEHTQLHKAMKEFIRYYEFYKDDLFKPFTDYLVD